MLVTVVTTNVALRAALAWILPGVDVQFIDPEGDRIPSGTDVLVIDVGSTTDGLAVLLRLSDGQTTLDSIVIGDQEAPPDTDTEVIVRPVDLEQLRVRLEALDPGVPTIDEDEPVSAFEKIVGRIFGGRGEEGDQPQRGDKATERAGAEREAAERAEAERRAEQREAAERAEREQLAAERQAAERQAAEREAAQRAEAERQAAEREAAERAEADRQAAEREAAERAEAERQAEQREAAERAERERLTAERQAAEKQAAEREAAQRAEAERQAAEREAAREAKEQRRAAAQQAKRERRAAKQAEAERRAAAAREASERAEAARLAAEREAADRAESERRAADRQAAEREAAQPEDEGQPDTSAPTPAGALDPEVVATALVDELRDRGATGSIAVLVRQGESLRTVGGAGLTKAQRRSQLPLDHPLVHTMAERGRGLWLFEGGHGGTALLRGVPLSHEEVITIIPLTDPDGVLGLVVIGGVAGHPPSLIAAAREAEEWLTAAPTT